MADEMKLPTEEDIRQLPRWARVAFAARCARRVLPLFKHHWSEAPEKHVQAVAGAVLFAEQSAAGRADAANASQFSKAAWEANRAAGHANMRISKSVSATMCYCADAAGAAGKQTDANVYVYAAGSSASSSTDGVVLPAIVADFQTLQSLVQTQKWTDDTPVPPEVFGPLWPDGPPPGWPSEEAAATGSEVDRILQALRKHNNNRRLAAAELGMSRVSLYKKLHKYGLFASKETSKETHPAAEPEDEPLIAVSFCGDDFTSEDMELVLRYLSALDREQGGAGLKVLKGRQMQPQPVEVTP